MVCDRLRIMTTKKALEEIRQLVEAFPEKKSDKDRLFVLFKIKVLVECIEQPLKKRTEKQKAAYDAKTRILKKALMRFLVALEAIGEKHDELGNLDVRDQIYAAIYRSFIQPQRGYVLPKTFGMGSEAANELVSAAVIQFLSHPGKLAASPSLKKTEDRFAAIQGHDVVTAQGTSGFAYFGYSNKV